MSFMQNNYAPNNSHFEVNNSTKIPSLMSLNIENPIFNSLKKPIPPFAPVKKISSPEIGDFNNTSFFKDFTWHKGKSNFGWATESPTLPIQLENFNDPKQVKASII